MERIRLYYDVVCPYSYLESHAVEAAEDAGDVEVDWLPFELRPAPRPLLEPRGDHLRTDWTANVYRHALARRVEIHLPRFQPRSTLPLGVCLWAGDLGKLRQLKHALYEAFFCEGEDIASDPQIRRAAERAELSPDDAIEAAYDASGRKRIAAIRAEAVETGVRGVPTLVAADGRTHWGLGGVERLLAGEPLAPRAS